MTETQIVALEKVKLDKKAHGDFWENAAWRWITVLAFKLNQMVEALILGRIGSVGG